MHISVSREPLWTGPWITPQVKFGDMRLESFVLYSQAWKRKEMKESKVSPWVSPRVEMGIHLGRSHRKGMRSPLKCPVSSQWCKGCFRLSCTLDSIMEALGTCWESSRGFEVRVRKPWRILILMGTWKSSLDADIGEGQWASRVTVEILKLLLDADAIKSNDRKAQGNRENGEF